MLAAASNWTKALLDEYLLSFRTNYGIFFDNANVGLIKRG